MRRSPQHASSCARLRRCIAAVAIVTAAACKTTESDSAEPHPDAAAAIGSVLDREPAPLAAPEPATARESMTVSTDHWEIELPADWVRKDDLTEDRLYFETMDTSKGMYIGALRPNDDVSPKQDAEYMNKLARETLHMMEDASWRLVDEHADHTQGQSVIIADYFAEGDSYRVVSKVIARPGLTIRASFHDYLCEDYDRSRAYFQPIIDSMRALPRQ